MRVASECRRTPGAFRSGQFLLGSPLRSSGAFKPAAAAQRARIPLYVAEACTRADRPTRSDGGAARAVGIASRVCAPRVGCAAQSCSSCRRCWRRRTSASRTPGGAARRERLSWAPRARNDTLPRVATWQQAPAATDISCSINLSLCHSVTRLCIHIRLQPDLLCPIPPARKRHLESDPKEAGPAWKAV